MYRQRGETSERKGRKSVGGRDGRGGGRGEFLGEDIISPMQIAFGLRPAEYTLALAARVLDRVVFSVDRVYRVIGGG